MIHTMLDLETLSLANNALILSIGAVKFDADTIYDRFEVRIDEKDAQRFGLHVDAETVMWWMSDEVAEARNHLLAMPKVDMASALYGFADWLALETPEQRGDVWGNGAIMDLVKLKSAYDAARIDYPISYKAEACYRTVKNRATDVELVRHGVLHVPADDALSQALHLQAICAKHGIVL